MRDKATVDLMTLIHDVVGATCTLGAAIENTQREYPNDEKLMARMKRMDYSVDRIDKAIDTYYLALKGKKRE